MTGSQRRQLRQRFSPHRYPVKTFKGDPTRPAYTLYSLWDYPTYLAAANELDELLTQWPHNRARTVALLAVRAAFHENGAPHWAEQLVWAEDQVNVHALMLQERRRARRYDPATEARYAGHLALAQIALAESQRRKQGPPTGKRGFLVRRRLPKRLYGLKASLPPQSRLLTPATQLAKLLTAAQAA